MNIHDEINNLLEKMNIVPAYTAPEYSDHRFLVITTYNAKGEICPHCQIIKKAYEMCENTASPEKRIPKIYPDSGDPRLEIAQRIADSIGLNGIPTPMLVVNGNIYLGHRGLMFYYGLLHTYM